MAGDKDYAPPVVRSGAKEAAEFYPTPANNVHYSSCWPGNTSSSSSVRQMGASILGCESV